MNEKVETNRMATTKKIGALLFDLGGVVLGINFDNTFATWAGYANVPQGSIKKNFTFDEDYKRHERGEINGQQYFASLRHSLGINLTDEQFIEGWNSVYTGELPGVRGYLSRLSERFPLYAFTNSNPTHRLVWGTEYRNILSLFRKVFNSSDMGVRKPEAEAFSMISQEIAMPLDRILFFDDTEENVRGAVAIGMQAIRVHSAADIEQAVSTLLS